jgi:hypothetical protein
VVGFRKTSLDDAFMTIEHHTGCMSDSALSRDGPRQKDHMLFFAWYPFSSRLKGIFIF